MADTAPSAILGSMNRVDGGRIPDAVGLDPVVEAYKKDVDRTLIRENLKLTTSERIEKMIAALRFAEAVRHSRVKDSPR
jgi:hypothetical protein